MHECTCRTARRDLIVDGPQRRDNASQYAGTFIIALSTLALEVTLTRLLSVTTWYHLAFFAVSIAMLGMTAGAVTVYLRPTWFRPEALRLSAAKACIAFAAVVPAALVVLCATPVEGTLTAKGLRSVLAVSVAALAPFYFSGFAISGVITKTNLPIGRIYASDLMGAALGCLLVLGGLEVLDAPTLIILCGLMGAVAGVVFAVGVWSARLRTAAIIVLCALAALLGTNSLTPIKIHPWIVKGERPGTLRPVLEKWNSFSRVVVFEKRAGNPQYWGASPLAPNGPMLEQYRMEIDGEAATTVRRFESLQDLEYLYFDVTNVAYYLRPRGSACVIGVGGGRDVQSAILFGHSRVTGIEVNPIFTSLLRNQLKSFAGLAGRDGVVLVTDEARSYLSRSSEKYSVIQMSLTDTWAATGAGAFSLSENVLYTMEAWRIFFEHLAPRGIFTVSRWFGSGALGETGRIVSLAMATLLDEKIERPRDHIAMVVSGNVSTLLLSREPLSREDLARLEDVCRNLGYNLVICPGQTAQDADLQSLLAASSYRDLKDAGAGKKFNYRPTRDENPYFFNMVNAKTAFSSVLQGQRSGSDESGVLTGNLAAARTLILLIMSLVVLSVLAVVLPIAVRTRQLRGRESRPRILWAGAAYFSLIGLGFMFVEMALVERLSVFLGHPIYALGVLLFTIIASAGVGSFASTSLPLTRRPWVYVYPVAIAAAIAAVRFVMPVLGHQMVSAAMPARIVVSVVTIMPLGLLMGAGFPTGMRLVTPWASAETPWYWALNGIFGVLGSALTVFVSIYSGISVSLYVGATCYLMLLVSNYAILRRRPIPGGCS